MRSLAHLWADALDLERYLEGPAGPHVRLARMANKYLRDSLYNGILWYLADKVGIIYLSATMYLAVQYSSATIVH